MAYIEVRLTGSEMVLATSAGCRRHIQAILRNSQNAHGLEDDIQGWAKHIEGACGELAAAKATGRYWGGTTLAYKNGDDIRGYQVRTRTQHSWDLIIRQDDPDTAVFVLVTGTAPIFRVHGWIEAKDGKRDEYRKTHGGRPAAWFVPQVVLIPFERPQGDLVAEILPDWLR